jgi:hypothetical protein
MAAIAAYPCEGFECVLTARTRALAIGAEAWAATREESLGPIEEVVPLFSSSSRPIRCTNCSAIPTELLESEVFRPWAGRVHR